MRLKCLTASLLAVVILAGVTACGSGSSGTTAKKKGYTIKFTSPDPQGEPETDYMTHFAKLVESDSHGQLTVKNYFDGVLAQAAGGMKLVATGSAQMTYVSTPTIASYVPAYNFFQTPFVFTDPTTIAKALHSPAVSTIDAKLLSKTGIKVLGWCKFGFVDLLNNKRAIKSTSDIKGLRFRVIPGSKLANAAMTALGAQPVPLDPTEVYTALEQGTINGNIDPMANFYSSKEYEVAKYLSIMPFQYNPMIVLINNKFLQGLPDDLRAVVLKDADETDAWEIKDATKLESKDETLMRAAGVHINVVSPEGIASFKTILRPVIESAYKTYGPELFHAFGISAPGQ